MDSIAGFFNGITNWFQNTFLKATYDPAADQLKQIYNNNVQSNLIGLQGTVASIGGGLGSAIMSIPGISSATTGALRALQNESQVILNSAKSMTPGQIAQAHADLKAKADALEARATAEGVSVESLQPEDTSFNFNRFMNNVFMNTLYTIIFFIVLALALLGSSLAANAAFRNKKPTPYIIYYMVYGFILFPISLILGLLSMFRKEKLFFSIWAPLHKGWTSNPLYNLFLLPFIYNPQDSISPSHFTSVIPIQRPPIQISAMV